MEWWSPSTVMRAPSSSVTADNPTKRGGSLVVVVVGLVRVGIVGLVGLVRRQWRTEASVDSLAQVFADLEERQPLLSDVHRLAGPRVATFVGLVLAYGEATKATDLDTFSAFQGLHHGIEDRIDDRL